MSRFFEVFGIWRPYAEKSNFKICCQVPHKSWQFKSTINFKILKLACYYVKNVFVVNVLLIKVAHILSKFWITARWMSKEKWMVLWKCLDLCGTWLQILKLLFFSKGVKIPKTSKDLHTRFKSTKLPFTRICKLLIRPTSYVKFVLIHPYSSLFVPNRLPGHRNECDTS